MCRTADLSFGEGRETLYSTSRRTLIRVRALVIQTLGLITTSSVRAPVFRKKRTMCSGGSDLPLRRLAYFMQSTSYVAK